jgi:hypothetical protein
VQLWSKLANVNHDLHLDASSINEALRMIAGEAPVNLPEDAKETREDAAAEIRVSARVDRPSVEDAPIGASSRHPRPRGSPVMGDTGIPVSDTSPAPAWIDRHLVDLGLVLVLEAGPRGRDQVGHWPRD